MYIQVVLGSVVLWYWSTIKCFFRPNVNVVQRFMSSLTLTESIHPPAEHTHTDKLCRKSIIVFVYIPKTSRRYSAVLMIILYFVFLDAFAVFKTFLTDIWKIMIHKTHWHLNWRWDLALTLNYPFANFLWSVINALKFLVSRFHSDLKQSPTW